MADADDPVNPRQFSNEPDIEMAPDVSTRRVRRPTERALAMLEDSLPEGPGALQSDDEDSNMVTLDARPRSPLRIRIRRIFKTAANKFGLVRTYHGRPSAVPQSHPADFLADDVQLPVSSKPVPVPSSAGEKRPSKVLSIHIPTSQPFSSTDFIGRGARKRKGAAKNSFRKFSCMTISTLKTCEMSTLTV